MMSRPARLILSSVAAVIAVIITFVVCVYVQGGVWGDKAVQSDAGPEFGVVVLAAVVAVVVGSLVFAGVLKVSRSRREAASKRNIFVL